MTTTAFENPANGYRETIGGGEIAGAFFLGPLYLLAKGLWTHALIWLALCLFLLAITPPFIVFLPPIYAALTPSLLKAHYLRKGWREIAEPPQISAPPPPSEGNLANEPASPSAQEEAATILGYRADQFLISLIAVVLGVPLLILAFTSHTPSQQDVTQTNQQADSLLTRTLQADSPAPAAPQSESEAVEFLACKVAIDDAAIAAGKNFKPVLDSEVLYSVRFAMSDGSVLASCSNLDNKMVVTRSPES